MALLAGIPECQQCQEGQTPPQARPCWPFPSARRVCPGSCWARAARCCRCYFLLVFLDIDTSSLHPQHGFQASVLFPMATKSQPGNLNPLTQLSGKGREVGEAPAPLGWSLQLHAELFESKTLVTMTKVWLTWSITIAQASRGTAGEGWDLQKSLLHIHPSPDSLRWLGLSTGLIQPAAPLCSISIPGMLLHEYPNCPHCS